MFSSVPGPDANSSPNSGGGGGRPALSIPLGVTGIGTAYGSETESIMPMNTKQKHTMITEILPVLCTLDRDETVLLA